MRGRRRPAAAVAALLAVGLAGCAPQSPGDPAFALADCAVHAVIDSRSGVALVGIEDLAPGPDGSLILSAYDRPAVEKALRSGDPAPEGGLFLAARDAVLAGSTRATPILPKGSVTGGLRPHGIAVSGDRIAVVNRRTGSSGGLDPVILELRLDPGAAPPGRIESIHRAAGFCALNDVAFDGDLLLATLDRASCGRPGLADLFPGAATGRLVEISRDGTRIAAEGFAFANGVTVTPAGLVAVAETRGRRIRLSDGRAIEVPGAPDNLSTAPDGRPDGRPDGKIVAALQPRLIRFALWRYGWLQSAPSRIVAVDPAGGAVETLFEDPSGALFAGATAAIHDGGTLIAGSVLSPGLLVCRKRAAP